MGPKEERTGRSVFPGTNAPGKEVKAREKGEWHFRENVTTILGDDILGKSFSEVK